MVIEEIGVEQQVTIIGQLVGVVVGETVIGVHLVVRHLMLHSEAGVFPVEVIAAFGESLVAFSIDANAVQIVAIIKPMLRVEVHLSAKASFLQSLDTQLTAEMPDMGMVITQKNIVLRGHRFIKERVLVVVHFHVIMAHMAKKHDAIVLSYLDTTVEIEIGHQHGIGVQIEKHLLALVGQRLLVVHINLSSD